MKMIKHKIIIQNQAKRDAANARNWYNNEQNGLGRRFTIDLRRILLSIAENPFAYSVRYVKNRKANLSIFPYGVYFYIDESSSTVYITAIMHHSQNQ